MATMKELCKLVPDAILMQAATYEVTRRKNCAYLKRMNHLDGERDVYDHCRTSRPQKGRIKNTASSEAMGTIGSRIVVKRFANSRMTCVCKSRIY